MKTTELLVLEAENEMEYELKLLTKLEEKLSNQYDKLVTNKPMTYREVGELIGISASNVYKIEKKALIKLRNAVKKLDMEGVI